MHVHITSGSPNVKDCLFNLERNSDHFTCKHCRGLGSISRPSDYEKSILTSRLERCTISRKSATGIFAVTKVSLLNICPNCNMAMFFFFCRMSHWWDVPIMVQQPPAGVWPAAVQLCGQQREEQDRHPVDGARGGSQRTTATSPTTGPHYQRVLGQGSGKFIIECGSGSRCKSSSIWIQGVK